MTPRIERVVVALDAVSENRAAIDTAARLAAHWRAQLHGVFVEDDDLLRLANLPFARQVSLGAGVERLTPQQAKRQMHAFAEYARRDLAAAARRRGVAWTFDIVRGVSGTEMASAVEGDFLVAGAANRPIGGHFRIDCRWWSTAEPPAASFLLASRQWEQEAGAIIALLRGHDPAGERLLDAAAKLAEASGAGLTVICPEALNDDDEFAPWLGDRIAAYAIPVEIDLIPASPTALIRRIVELEGRLVAIAAEDPQARPENLRHLIARIGCDVLVVR